MEILLIGHISPIKFAKSFGQKWKIFQAKTFGFGKILFHIVSLNTEIFSYEQISHIPTCDEGAWVIAIGAMTGKLGQIKAWLSTRFERINLCGGPFWVLYVRQWMSQPFWSILIIVYELCCCVNAFSGHRDTQNNDTGQKDFMHNNNRLDTLDNN